MSNCEDQCLLKGQDMRHLHCLVASCRCNGVMAFLPFQHLWGISVTSFCKFPCQLCPSYLLWGDAGLGALCCVVPMLQPTGFVDFCCLCLPSAGLGSCCALPGQGTSSVPCSCLLWCRVAARTNGQSEFLLLCSCPFSSQNVPYFVYILQYIFCAPPTENFLILTFACGFGDLNLGLKIICLMVGFTL